MNTVHASLVYDSWEQPTPGLRSAFPDRHLIFEGGGLILELLVTSEDNAIRISGQILPDDVDLQSVCDVRVVLQQRSQSMETQTNVLGEFAFRGVPNRSFDLTITLRDRLFLLKGLSTDEPGSWRVVLASASAR